jgi:membrane protein
MILMLKIYFNSLILLIGYELNVSIHHLRALAEERALRSMEKEGGGKA